MEPNVLYHTPNAKGIDFFLFQDETIFIAQIASGTEKLKKKHQDLKVAISAIANNKNTSISGWFISFFPFNLSNTVEKEGDAVNINITSASDLRQLLGNQIYDKLEETKKLL